MQVLAVIESREAVDKWLADALSLEQPHFRGGARPAGGKEPLGVAGGADVGDSLRRGAKPADGISPAGLGDGQQQIVSFEHGKRLPIGLRNRRMTQVLLGKDGRDQIVNNGGHPQATGGRRRRQIAAEVLQRTTQQQHVEIVRILLGEPSRRPRQTAAPVARQAANRRGTRPGLFILRSVGIVVKHELRLPMEREQFAHQRAACSVRRRAFCRPTGRPACRCRFA